MQIHQLKDLLKDFDKNVIYDQDLKKKSWFNIGGKSKVFYKAENLKEKELICVMGCEKGLRTVKGSFAKKPMFRTQTRCLFN